MWDARRVKAATVRLQRCESNESYDRQGVELQEQYDRTDLIATAHRVRSLLCAVWPALQA
jgi:hypothetical protein